MSNGIPQVKNFYETYWSAGKGTFSGSRQPYAKNFRRWMDAELAGLRPDAPVIEVGCGDASFTLDLARHSSRVTAIDISSGQIAENTRSFPGIRFLQHDVAERFPFDDSEFEVVWCSEVLEHLFDPAFALREMHRILRPGGRLLVTVPYHGRLKGVLIALFKWDVHFAPHNPHIRFFTNRTLSRIVEAAGFESLKVVTCGMGAGLRDLFVPTNTLLRASKRPAAGAE